MSDKETTPVTPAPVPKESKGPNLTEEQIAKRAKQAAKPVAVPGHAKPAGTKVR